MVLVDAKTREAMVEALAKTLELIKDFLAVQP
jgi:hypothetical protein